MQILLCITTNIPDYEVSERNEPEKIVHKNSFYTALRRTPFSTERDCQPGKVSELVLNCV